MFQFLIGAFVLIGIYALIPKRFTSVADVSRQNGYSRKENMLITAYVGAVSLVMTMLVGMIFYWIGSGVLSSNRAMMEVVSPLVLIITGIIYLGIHVKGDLQEKSRINMEAVKDKEKEYVIGYILRREFLVPNVMLGAYCFLAAFFRLTGLVLILIMYFIVGLAGICFLADMYYRGNEKIKFNVLAAHNEEIMGAILMGLGIFFYFTGL